MVRKLAFDTLARFGHLSERMLDLSVLKNRWTEEGAREVFEELVLHCARTKDNSVRRVRADPGDEGIDSFLGDLNSTVRIWQAKFFCDGIGNAQKAQIRDAWKSCSTSPVITKVHHWTLCIPIHMSPPEMKWWQDWIKKDNKNQICQFDLWDKSDFVLFSVDNLLKNIFDFALERGIVHTSRDGLLSGLRQPTKIKLLENLPKQDYLKEATFVKKLEAAGIKQHAAVRRAFYNFELLRTSLDAQQLKELDDLLARVHSIWEKRYNLKPTTMSDRDFYYSVIDEINSEDRKKLATPLPAGPVHKEGSIHFWADICKAGWTANYEDLLAEKT